MFLAVRGAARYCSTISLLHQKYRTALKHLLQEKEMSPSAQQIESIELRRNFTSASEYKRSNTVQLVHQLKTIMTLYRVPSQLPTAKRGEIKVVYCAPFIHKRLCIP